MSNNRIKVYNNCKKEDITQPPPTPLTFSAELNGTDEVPPNSSQGTGNGVFELSSDRTELAYSITLDTVPNVIGAHIHAGVVGENGEVLLALVGNPLIDAPGITVGDDGILVEGVATSADVQGSFVGDLDGLVQAMKDGSTYVNIHTIAFPSGEVRGQVQRY